MKVSRSNLTQLTQDLQVWAVFWHAFTLFVGVKALPVLPPGFKSCKLG